MLTPEALITGLRQYISKNKAIPDFFKKLDSDNRNAEHERALSDLKGAIIAGDPNAPIFKNQFCSLYLLYLIEKSEIPFWQGITAYFYCLMIMQFTDAQPLLERDEALYRIKRPFEVDLFTNNNTLTDVGRAYLNNVKARYAKYPTLLFDENKIVEAAMQGSVIDNWLFSFKYNSADVSHSGMKRMVDIIAPDLLFVAQDTDGLRITIPSVHLMNAFMQPKQGAMMIFKPVLGNVGVDTLQRLHTEEYAHPLALYSPWVQSSVSAVHSIKCGPIMVFMHDVVHAFWMNIFTPAEREIIYQFVELLKNCSIERDDQPGLKLFEAYKTRVIFKCLDFNLSTIADMPKERSEWLPAYLMKAFGSKGRAVGVYANLEASRHGYRWMLPEDDMLYCLGRLSALGEPWASLYRRNMDEARSGAQRDVSVLGRIQQAVETQNKGESMRLSFTFRFFGVANQGGELKKTQTPTRLLK